MHLPVAAGAQRVEARDAHQHTGIALCCSIVLSISQAHTTPLSVAQRGTENSSGTAVHGKRRVKSWAHAIVAHFIGHVYCRGKVFCREVNAYHAGPRAVTPQQSTCPPKGPTQTANPTTKPKPRGRATVD